jgi:hypothetical protein
MYCGLRFQFRRAHYIYMKIISSDCSFEYLLCALVNPKLGEGATFLKAAHKHPAALVSDEEGTKVS